MASHLALSALMAIFPFLIVVATVAGLVGEAPLATQVADLLFQTWPPEIAGPIANEVHNVLTVPRGGLLTISIVITLYAASNGVEAVRMGLNRAYRAVDRRSGLARRAQSIFFVIIGAMSALALGLLGVLGPLIWEELQRQFPNLDAYSSNFTTLRYLVVGGLLAGGLVFAHLWLPASRPRAFRLWPGILLTLALWWLVTSLFTTYLRNFTNYGATYAGLAGVVGAIFFLYLIGLIMIIGGEVNAAIDEVRFGGKPPRHPRIG